MQFEYDDDDHQQQIDQPDRYQVFPLQRQNLVHAQAREGPFDPHQQPDDEERLAEEPDEARNVVHDGIETLPAGDNSQQLLIDIRIKLANDDFIRVIGVDGQLPLQFAVAADHVVAAENFILAVAVEVVGIGEVAGVVVGELPPFLSKMSLIASGFLKTFSSNDI